MRQPASSSADILTRRRFLTTATAISAVAIVSLSVPKRCVPDRNMP